MSSFAGLLLSPIAVQLIVEAIKTLSQMDRVPRVGLWCWPASSPPYWVR